METGPVGGSSMTQAFPRSVVIREAFNRMVVQMAVLYRLLRG